MAQLPDDELQHYLDEIARLGKVYAAAKRRAAMYHELRKITKASLMKMARALGQARSRDTAEEWAYTHPQYKEVSDKMLDAIEDETNAAVAHANAERAWESWRTICANERAISRAG